MMDFKTQLLSGLVALTIFWSASDAMAEVKNVATLDSPDQKVFKIFAKEIIKGVTNSSTSRPPKSRVESALKYLKQTYASVYGKKQRIAIWPFHAENIPIAKSVADGFNDQLLTEMLNAEPGPYEFVARDALKPLIADLSETGALEAEDDPVAALMSRARNIDILVQGRMRLVDKGLSLGYKAVRMDGAIVAQTKRIIIPLKVNDKIVQNNLLTLDQSVDRAANHFAEALSDLSEIRLGAIQYQTTGMQPPFGRFLKERIVASLQNEYSKSLGGRIIKVGRNLRGISVETKEIKENRFSKESTSYLLTGSYWIFNKAIEIRLSLRNPEGRTVFWTGRIRSNSVGNLQLVPPGNFDALRENDGLGPFEFKLTSKRGNNPIYKVGENIDLLIKVGKDAWTYCFYHQADGKIIQIFPNPHFWRRFKSPHLTAGKIHTVPGKTTFPFDLKLTPPLGNEMIKCFAATRDVTNDLPVSLRGKSLAPLQISDIRDLSARFRKLPYTAIAETSLVITVVDN